MIPGAGHDVNVHFESYRWFAFAAERTRRMVQDGGPCGGQPPAMAGTIPSGTSASSSM